MNKQYAIMRFAKYKGPEIGMIEAHNERTKETYASNPDIDHTRTQRNFHLIQPATRYRTEIKRQIAVAGCRTRSDSVRMVEVLIASSPEFFKGKKVSDARAYFQHALDFLQQKQRPETFLSAVVHLDEKTPHMHVTFVPLTEDGRLCAKEIIGNRKQLTAWQDAYWQHMVAKYPELERGESASKTGREHIPTWLYKEAVDLSKQAREINAILDSATPFNAKRKLAEAVQLLHGFFPRMEQFQTQMKKRDERMKELKAENQQLKDDALAARPSLYKTMDEMKLQAEYSNLKKLVARIPPELLDMAATPNKEPVK